MTVVPCFAASDLEEPSGSYAARSGPLRLRVTTVSDVGAVRSKNEDCFDYTGRSASAGQSGPWSEVVDSGSFLGVVADGLGGHPCGELASELAVETVMQYAPKSSGELIRSIEAADRSLLDKIELLPGCSAMGTTIVTALFAGERLTVANVGDSCAFGFANGRLHLLTSDDAVSAARLPGVPTGGISQALGVRHNKKLRVHRNDIRASEDLRVLLCTDGLTGYVPLPEIADVLRLWAGSEAVAHLLHLTFAAGAPDNLTIVLLEPEPND